MKPAGVFMKSSARSNARGWVAALFRALRNPRTGRSNTKNWRASVGGSRTPTWGRLRRCGRRLQSAMTSRTPLIARRTASARSRFVGLLFCCGGGGVMRRGRGSSPTVSFSGVRGCGGPDGDGGAVDVVGGRDVDDEAGFACRSGGSVLWRRFCSCLLFTWVRARRRVAPLSSSMITISLAFLRSLRWEARRAQNLMSRFLVELYASWARNLVGAL